MRADVGGKSRGEVVLRGIGVSSGIAVGPAFVIGQHGVPIPEYNLVASGVDKELKRFQAAIAKEQKHLNQLKSRADVSAYGPSEEIGLLMEAYRGMIQPGSRLARGVEETIQREKINAEAAVRRQIVRIAESFAAMKDPYLASRAADVRDVGDRLIRQLMSQSYNPFADAPEGSILIAEEITPADAALVNPDSIVALAAVLGGAEGHTAIMARAMRLPAVLGVAALVSGVQTGDTVIIDGRKGEVILRPSPESLQAARQDIAKQAREIRRLKGLVDLPSETRDGAKVALEANLELPREAARARESGAAGIGLYRTEFLFMNRRDLPDEEEQYEALRRVVEEMKGRPVTIRTLDVGGEKLATALGGPVGESANPALGLRAIRLGLRMPRLLETQLAAILRASAHGPVRILVPMVSSANQMRAVRERVGQVSLRLRRRGVKIPAALPPLGAMIEIPAAALASDSLSKVCDFFAIGSNDLTQYTLAIDRGDDRVADLYDPYHPAVLRLIQFTIAAAWRANIPVSLCGELAGDPRATALLLGLGLRDFSMAPARLPFVKERLRSLLLPDALDLAEKILAKSEEADIRALLDAQSPGSPGEATRRKRG